MNLRFFLIFFLFFPLSSIHASSSFSLGKDRGTLSEKHVQVSEDFINKNLKSNDQYSEKKIIQFISFLKEEKEKTQTDIYETEVIERVELEIKKYKNSEKKAKKKATDTKSIILKGYQLYLIPKMEALLESVRKHEDKSKQDAITHDFIRGYISYYVPNAHRTAWPRDLDLFPNVKKMFRTYDFNAVDESLTAASNLFVGEENLKDIQACLGSYKKQGEYLSPKEIKKLRKCQFDLSLLDPGVSSLWKNLKEEDLNEIRLEGKGTYPEEGEEVYFDEVILRGHQSPKIKVTFKRGDKEFKVKLKMGYEVHSDTAVSKLSEFIGLNQDSMKYYQKIKVYLGDTSYDDFCSMLANKYGVESIIRYITAYGEGEKGTWLLFHDVVLEARDNDELRVGPIDFSSWDLGNRREYRSLLLFWGWLSIQNTKPSNFKILFRETAEGLIPLHRMHDLGTSLGAPFSLRRFGNLLSLLENETVNAFPDSFLKFNKDKDGIKILWNDMSQFSRIFKYTTWDDLKWMGRKILKIRKEDIYFSLIQSGMPKAVADIYLIKLLKKRNEIRKVFSLENEFKGDDFQDLESLNVKSKEGDYVIKNGKLLKGDFKDKNSLPLAPQKWITFLSGLLSFDLPIYEWMQPKTKNTTSLSTSGMEGLNISMGVKDADVEPFAITTLPIGAGVEAILSRSVSVNDQMMNNNKEFHIYKIVDRVKLQFSVESPLLKKVVATSTIADVDASLKFYEYEFKFTHFKDTLREAYFSKFNLPKIIAKPIKYAAYEMNPLEMISTYQRVGLEIEGDLRVFSMSPGIRNQIALTAGIARSSRKYLLRDQYGQLHVYKDNLRSGYIGFSFGLAEIDLFFTELPFFKIQMSTHHFKLKVTDYIFPLESHDRRKVDSVLTLERRREEYLSLKKFKSWKEGSSLPPLMKLNYEMASKGKSSTFGIGGAFLFNRLKTKEESRTNVTLPSGEKKDFYRYSLTKSKSIGIDSVSLPLLDILVSKRKKIHIVMEADLKKIEDSVIAVRVQDYYKVRDRKELGNLINDLNRRYSSSAEEKFYRGHELPGEEFTNKYRKVYGISRFFLDVKDLGRKIVSLSEGSLKKLLTKHFWDTQFLIQDKKIGKKRRRDRFKISFKRYRALKVLKKIKEDFVKKFGKKEETKHLRLYVKLLEKLKIEDYGLHFLKSLLRQKDLLVFGEIAGVIPSYSTLQDLQSLQRRRFAAKHWGKLNKHLPIQKHLRYERVLPPLIHIAKNMSDSFIFGELETCLAPNLEALFGTSTDF